jgi:hypothetical protein
MTDPTCISTTKILWCANHKYMLLAAENRLKAKIDGLVDDDIVYSGW